MSPTLGQRVRALRKEQGLSQADLAGDMVSPSYVSLIEAGRRSPEREVLEGLARKLGCSALYLSSGVAPEEITEQRLQLQFAEIAFANGSIDEAHDQFTRLAGAASGEIRLGALWGLARTEESLGNLHASLAHRDALLESARAGEPGAPKLVNLLEARCRILRNAGDFARSIEVGEDALREVRELGLEGTEDEITLAATLVSSYWARGDLFSAQHLADQVIERAERLGSRTAQGNAYWSACLLAAGRGQLTLALDLATKALALFSEYASHEMSLAMMRVNYGWLLLQYDPPPVDEARSVLERAHEALCSMPNEQILAGCETELARAALLRGEYPEAVSLAQHAVARCEGNDSAELEGARVVEGLARVLSDEVAAGVEMVATAAGRLEDMGSRLDASRAYRELGEALLETGHVDLAVTAFRQAADSAGARGSVIPPRDVRVKVSD
jgi:transcriptional regulator with XRE-family HTH domain